MSKTMFNIPEPTAVFPGPHEKRSSFLRFEFWPYQLLYFPVFFYYLWLALKARSLTFFTAANPGIYLGGFVGESKKEILQKIHTAYLPATLYFYAGSGVDMVLLAMESEKIDFPCIIKPETGERGDGVEKLENEQQLSAYLSRFHVPFIIQEFITGTVEAGVLYYRLPDGSGSGITSVVLKSFLTVTGNGQSSLRELICSNFRAKARLDYLLNKFSTRLDEVLPVGENLELEPIGNHCRGTEFLSGQVLISPKMVRAFDLIAQDIDGFFIGRFDIKVNSLGDLEHAAHIRIMELNGVTSEPAHIYDPQGSLAEAYRALFGHYRLIYRIARQNHQRGIPYAAFSELWKQVRKHHKK